MRELNASGFLNREIAWQVDRSLSFVEKSLNGQKRFIWKLPLAPPLTKVWRGGTESASRELKRMREAVGTCLWSLWSVKAEPGESVPGRPGRPAATRQHQVLVERAVRDLAAACSVSESAVWRWVYPSRVAEIYRHGNRD